MMIDTTDALLLRPARPSLAWNMIGLTSNDLTGDWRRLKDAGVEFIEDPTDYGTVRIATLKDPEGNLVQLIQSSQAT